LAERFLQLSPDAIYGLAERTTGTPLGTVPPELLGDSLPDAGSEAFRELIERVTEALVAELGLPTFEQWSEAYRSDPAQFDRDLLGLWREAV
jgi:hypothetical protein